MEVIWYEIHCYTESDGSFRFENWYQVCINNSTKEDISFLLTIHFVYSTNEIEIGSSTRFGLIPSPCWQRNGNSVWTLLRYQENWIVLGRTHGPQRWREVDWLRRNRTFGVRLPSVVKGLKTYRGLVPKGTGVGHDPFKCLNSKVKLRIEIPSRQMVFWTDHKVQRKSGSSTKSWGRSWREGPFVRLGIEPTFTFYIWVREG